jgi:2-keto-4-pentenoate hydratase/2-oxohepta-3-ene-1,7-dioic acid hydratase in catechol pathway
VKDITLCTIRKGKEQSLGVRTAGGILDVKRAALARKVSAPHTVDDAIRGRDLAGLRKLLAEVQRSKKKSPFLIDEAKAKLGPCVTNPEKIIMMGLNYRRHCLEVKLPIPAKPVFFNKYNNSLLGHGGTLPLPTKVSTQFDYEAELVVVMGKRARDVSAADALSYVFGYCTGNDFSARDLQFQSSQFMLGKTCDGFAPIGPWLVSADQIPDPQALRIECRVNGQVRQSSSTSDMIFGCADLVSFASQHMTLLPGDIIFTGTPEGVIQGKPEAERVWLKAGDVVTTEIEKVGRLEFTLG